MRAGVRRTAAAAEPRSAPRRKPQTRSAVTRESLLDAALQCLVERGYARTATADVAARAHVSRGALLHHFPTRAGLLAATVEHLAERRLAELRATIAAVPASADRIAAAVDFVWSAYGDSTACATLELLIAARTDDDLQASLRPVIGRFDEILRQLDHEIATDPEERQRFVAFRHLVVVAMQGLAVMRVVRDDDEYVRGILGLLKTLCRDVLPTAGTKGS